MKLIRCRQEIEELESLLSEARDRGALTRLPSPVRHLYLGCLIALQWVLCWEEPGADGKPVPTILDAPYLDRLHVAVGDKVDPADTIRDPPVHHYDLGGEG